MKQLNFFTRSILAALLWMILFIPSSQAQLKNWTLPGHYVDVSTGFIPSNLPTLAGGFDGLPTPASHNLVHDENGNLLFFVVGTEIYHHDGRSVGSITQNYYNVDPITLNPIPNAGNNSTEMAIIPVPCDNDRYFVVFGQGELNRANIRYGMVDLSLDPANGLLVQPYTDPQTNVTIPGVRGVLDIAGSQVPQINFAVSSEINEEHHLYVQVGGNIRAFKTGEINSVPTISPIGSSSTDHTINIANTTSINDNSAGSISGTELELSHDNTKLVTVSSLRNGSSNNYTTYYEVFDLDPITGAFLGTSTEYSFTNVGLGKGMAFSPNGQYLWVTLAANPDFLSGAQTAPTIGVNYFPLTAGGNPPLTTLISDADFSLSQLEIAANGSLIALGDNTSGTNPRIALINNPDNPNSSSSSIITATGMSFPLNNKLGTGLLYDGMRLIPDQIETHAYGIPPLNILGQGYEFDCDQDASVCPVIMSGTAPYTFTVIFQGATVFSGTNVESICFPVGEECGVYTLKVSDARCQTTSVPIQINRIPTPGVLSGPAHISPPDPFTLSLSGYSGEYVEYQLLTNCASPNPNGWVTIVSGPLPQHDVVFNTTHQWINCFLTDDLTYCFRARVYCKEPKKDDESTNCLPAITEIICIPVCAKKECDPGGGIGASGGDDPSGKMGLLDPNIDFNVFPNPAENKLNIHIEKAQSAETVLIRVMDLQGKVLNELAVIPIAGESIDQKLDLSNLTSGMYLINVSGTNFSITKKFFKQ